MGGMFSKSLRENETESVSSRVASVDALPEASMGASSTSYLGGSVMLEPQEEVDNRVALFHLKADIVGKRFYNGRMHSGEMILLSREPRNPYDSNAIKACTVSGHQVGHIAAKDGTARMLAPLMDYRLQGGIGAAVEAVVCHQNYYKAMAEIRIIGRLDDREHIKSYFMKYHWPFHDLNTGQVSRIGSFTLHDFNLLILPTYIVLDLLHRNYLDINRFSMTMIPQI